MIKTERPAVNRKARLRIRANSSHAAGLPFFFKYSESTGIKATPSAPPDIKAESKSGMLLAALKTSILCVKPNSCAIRI